MPDQRGHSGGSSPIETILYDGTFHMFTPQVLDVMLANSQVSRFMRSYGWVTIGADPVRVKSRREPNSFYHGTERRSVN
jgi:hypothetical protein